MKCDPKWHAIAERLSESGWSWQHTTFTNRVVSELHVAEARDDRGHVHAAVADSILPAFAALEESVQLAGQ